MSNFLQIKIVIDINLILFMLQIIICNNGDIVHQAWILN